MSETTGGVRAHEGPAGIGGWLLLPLAHLALYACVLLVGFVRLSAQMVPGFVDATAPAPLVAGDTARLRSAACWPRAMRSIAWSARSQDAATRRA